MKKTLLILILWLIAAPCSATTNSVLTMPSQVASNAVSGYLSGQGVESEVVVALISPTITVLLEGEVLITTPILSITTPAVVVGSFTDSILVMPTQVASNAVNGYLKGQSVEAELKTDLITPTIQVLIFGQADVIPAIIYLYAPVIGEQQKWGGGQKWGNGQTWGGDAGGVFFKSHNRLLLNQ